MKSPKITTQSVDHLSSLASLPLTDSEKKLFAQSLTSVIEYIGEVQKIDIHNTPVTAQVTGKVNEFREDSVEKSLTQAEAISQSQTATHNGYFVVKRVLNND